MLTPRRHVLSPIVENPQEVEKSLAKCESRCIDTESTNLLFHEEMSRLGKISLDDLQLPSPSKRRKLNSCSLESQMEHSFGGLLTSPIKTLSV